MRVANRLAAGLANIDTDVVTVRRRGRFYVAPDRWNKGPYGDLFLPTERKKVGFVPPRDDKAVSVIQWESVWKRGGMFVRGHEVSASEPVTEDTSQFVSPNYPRSTGSHNKIRVLTISVPASPCRYGLPPAVDRVCQGTCVTALAGRSN